jgi:hypothetical protein
MDDPGSKLKQGKLSKHLISARQPKAHPAARFQPSVNRLSAALGHVQVEDDSNWDPLDHVILHLTLSLNPDKSWRKDADRRDLFVKLLAEDLAAASELPPTSFNIDKISYGVTAAHPSQAGADVSDKIFHGVTFVECKLSLQPSEAGTDVLAVANSLRRQVFDSNRHTFSNVRSIMPLYSNHK